MCTKFLFFSVKMYVVQYYSENELLKENTKAKLLTKIVAY